MNIRDLSIVMVGAGNVAFHLTFGLRKSGIRIKQVFSRTAESALPLAYSMGASYTTSIEEIIDNADVYIVALKDSVLDEILPQLVKRNPKALFVHTAGSVSIDIWKGLTDRYGVLYPMQTFSKQREINFSNVHFFVEANNHKDVELLKDVAYLLSNKVFEASSEQRKYLHISAVFACNFTNHMYAICQQLLEKNGLPFSSMLPLIDETANKVHHLSPVEAQTGPAKRYDTNIMEQHIKMLENEPEIASLYKEISENIHKYDIENH